MITQFSSMRDEHLGKICNAEHHNALLTNLKAVHSASFQASPIVREFRCLQIEKMLFETKIEQARTEWKAPIVLCTKKKMDPSASASTIETSTT